MEESFYSDYLRGAILLAPCTKMNVLQGTQGYHYYNDLVDELDLIGLYGLHGQNWEQFKPEVCAHLARQWCEQERIWEEEPISARALNHFLQMGIEGRFQEYSESYIQGKEHRITADIPLENIRETPIAVMYGDADRVCPMHTVEWMMGEIGHMVYGNYQFGGYDHADFGRANDQIFMNELHEALAHLQPNHGHEDPHQLEEDLSHALQEEFQRQDEEDLEHEIEELVHKDEDHHASWRDGHAHTGFDLRHQRAAADDHHGSHFEHVAHDEEAADAHTEEDRH